jgi:hypothetical protein
MAQYITITTPPSIEAIPCGLSIRTSTVIQIVEVIEVIITRMFHAIYNAVIRPMYISIAYIRNMAMRGPPLKEVYYYGCY